MALYIFGIVGGGLPDNFIMLMAASIVQGIWMSVIPIVFVIIQTQFLKDKIVIGRGTLASTFSFVGVYRLNVGGNVTDNFGWHMIFLSIIQIKTIVTIIIKYFIVIESKLQIEIKQTVY